MKTASQAVVKQREELALRLGRTSRSMATRERLTAPSGDTVLDEAMPSEGPNWPVGAKICLYIREFRASLRRIADMPDWLAVGGEHIYQRHLALGSVQLRSTRQVGVELAIRFPLSKGVCLFGVAPGCAVRDD